MDTKMMSNQSSLKPKQIESQLNSRRHFSVPGKEAGSLTAKSNSKKVNTSKPTGGQGAVVPNSSTSAVHSNANLNMHSNVNASALSSSNFSLSSYLTASSHPTVAASSSKPACVGSREANRMIGNRSNQTAGSTNRTLNQTKNQSNTQNSNRLPAVSQTGNYPCQLCEFKCDDIKSLNFHLVKIHKIDQRINLVQCYVTGCEAKFRKRMELVGHLNDVHHLGVVVLRKTVASLEEFQRWKDELERQSGCTWIMNNRFVLNNHLRMTYICGKPATNGSKLYSLHGQTTINNQLTFCLSSIKVTESDDAKFLIEFIETHNHDE